MNDEETAASEARRCRQPASPATNFIVMADALDDSQDARIDDYADYCRHRMPLLPLLADAAIMPSR